MNDRPFEATEITENLVGYRDWHGDRYRIEYSAHYVALYELRDETFVLVCKMPKPKGELSVAKLHGQFEMDEKYWG